MFPYSSRSPVKPEWPFSMPWATAAGAAMIAPSTRRGSPDFRAARTSRAAAAPAVKPLLTGPTGLSRVRTTNDSYKLGASDLAIGQWLPAFWVPAISQKIGPLTLICAVNHRLQAKLSRMRSTIR